jgi:hypothetical protein
MSEVCIVCGGTNDVGRNETIAGIHALKYFLSSHNHTNVIVLSVPQRHDLTENSRVNQEVNVFNMLDKLKMAHQNLTVVTTNKQTPWPLVREQTITVDTNRDLYTRHGLDLNSQGKEHSANRIC